MVGLRLPNPITTVRFRSLVPAILRRFLGFEKRAMPSEKEFRDAGYTIAASQYPLSDGAFIALCAFNNIAPSRAPRAWKFAPNPSLRDAWERVSRSRSSVD